MAAYTSLLLVIALCALAVYSLQCYECESTNANCWTETTCTGGETYCQTTVSAGSVKVVSVTKQCARSCSLSSNSINGLGVSVSCCNTDLCNYSGGASIKSSYAAIILALGSVLIILKSSAL